MIFLYYRGGKNHGGAPFNSIGTPEQLILHSNPLAMLRSCLSFDVFNIRKEYSFRDLVAVRV